MPSYLGLLLNVSRRNLDRVLYFAQYVVTHVDEDARERALKRLEEELQEAELRLEQEIDEQVEAATAETRERLEALTARLTELNETFEDRLANVTDEVAEAKSVEQKLNNLQGKEAPEQISLGGTCIVAKGETVGREIVMVQKSPPNG